MIGEGAVIGLIVDLPQEVIDGFDFLFLLAKFNDNLCYADQQDQDNLKAAGEWFRKYKETLCSKDKVTSV